MNAILSTLPFRWLAGSLAGPLDGLLRAGCAAAALLWLAGAPAWAGETVTTPDGERVTVVHEWRPGGVVREWDEYVTRAGKRVKHGVYKKYFRNGWMREYITYRHGERHGPFKFWHDGNVLQVQGEYRDGNLHGLIIRYYASGQKQRETTYRDGELHGPFFLYDRNGRTRERGTFNAGMREGAYVEYFDDGKPAIESTYEKGELNGAIALFDESGRLAAQGTLAGGRVRGTWICHPTGDKPGRERNDCGGKEYWECLCD